MSEAEELAVLESTADAVVERWGSGDWAAEVLAAKDEYARRAGKIFEDDEIFEARTASFLEWYAVERPLAAAGVPPAALAMREAAGGAGQGGAGQGGAGIDAEACAAWLASHRSLFVVEELGAGRVVLDDLYGGGRFEVDERRRLAGVSPGDLVEARVVGWRGKVRFGRTFLYHPAGARDAIETHIARVRDAGGTRADATDLIATLKVRTLRYRNVAPERVYDMIIGSDAQR